MIHFRQRVVRTRFWDTEANPDRFPELDDADLRLRTHRSAQTGHLRRRAGNTQVLVRLTNRELIPYGRRKESV